jgi:hypothetical protein
MCCCTSGGTMPSIATPVASRLRIAVDDTSAVTASIKKITGTSDASTSRDSVTIRPASRGSRSASPVAGNCGRETTTKCAASRMLG